MPEISVLTPTVRIKGLELVRESLARQTFSSFEWLIVSPQDIPVALLSNKARLIKDPPKHKGYFWTFNQAMNKAIKQAEGELIVSIQDYTSFESNGLEKFWYYFTHGYDKALISGVGDKYDDECMRHLVWSDPRMRRDFGTFYECMPNDVEFNYASCPKKAFYEVGGFDEELDKYAGMDHISVQERLDDVGYKFYLDQTNITKSLVHERLLGWEESHARYGGYEKRKQELKEKGIWPKLGYLS